MTTSLKPLHLVMAFASKNSLVLGQVTCVEKSNETLELVKLLNIQKATVTIDVMGDQKEIAAQIRQQDMGQPPVRKGIENFRSTSQ